VRGPAVQPIVIAAGGTGGHFFPAEALAAALIARGHRVVLMTDARSGALNSTVFAGREQYCLRGSGISGRGPIRALRSAAALVAGTMQARTILNALNPAVIVGFGGYPSVPPVLAARTLRHRPRVLLHEQNAVLGRANIFLSRFADALALGAAGTKRIPVGVQSTVIGNPVRPVIQAIAGQPYAPPTEIINLLILGGSLGARVFSDVVPNAIKLLAAPLRTRLRITQQCRTEDIDRVRAAYAGAGIKADLASFFANVADKLAESHLVITRAGASTCAELTIVGRPAILVPLPGAIDDHQTANATILADAGAAHLIAQTDFTPELLAAILTKLLADSASLANKAAAAAHAAHRNAAGALADLVEQHIGAEASP
jgi:UDP-N-acetylglucosamine--N-acetylmuramyl-(pentapeptide) pyrophosphoryl-undecaprenol N-acetylglucosamine transferase